MARATAQPLSSRSTRRTRFSRAAGGLGGDFEAVVLLELVIACVALAKGFVAGVRGSGEEEEAVGEAGGWGERADRQAVVRREGSSSEKM